MLSLTCCASGPRTSEQTTITPVSSDRPEANLLTEAHARYRAEHISDVNYSLSFNLSETDPEFQGVARIQFLTKGEPSPLTLDFSDGKILTLEINGSRKENPDYNGHFLKIPAKELSPGSNVIVIRYSHSYSKRGSGLIRFQDPEDSKFYLHTNFEPYDAHTVFPCFDQPNLKGTFSLTVEAPKNWTVISAVRESAIRDTSDELGNPTQRRIWTFPESAKFSTYLFSLIAGDYQSWSSSAGGIPLRLFARRSMAQYVPVAEWFKFTQAGFRYFAKTFDTPYPFKKYDQILVPDFITGAMENVGAVVFNERFLPRGNTTSHDRKGRAGILLHELAHMWFGNLVTMNWWNDLWLNESFATYMSYAAQAEATEFKDAWSRFYAGTKQWAYWQDRLLTTHPIAGTVSDTDQAFANFDGISYGKGASVIKQLAFLVGSTNFNKGLRSYFKRFQFSNTELRDFIASIEEASGVSLEQWKSEWLQNSGPNTLSAEYQCQDNTIASFALLQTAPLETPTLRTHRTQIGLYKKSTSGVINLKETAAITYSGDRTEITALTGKPCPDFVNLNEGDHDYVITRLDERSLETIKTSLSKFSDPSVRIMAWKTIWDRVQFADIKIQNYLETLTKHLPKETDNNNLKSILGTLEELISYLPPTSETSINRHKINSDLEDFLWKGVRQSPHGSETQKIYWDSLVSIAQNPDSLSQFSDILEDQNQINGFKLDPDRRWTLIREINAYDPPLGEPLRIKEETKDKTSIGRDWSMVAEVAQPILEIKNYWFNRIASEKSDLTVKQIQKVAGSFFRPNQERFKRHFADRYFQLLNKFTKTRDSEFLWIYTSNLAPTLCEEWSMKKFEDFLSDHSQLPATVKKPLLEALQRDERCIRVRSLAIKNP